MTVTQATLGAPLPTTRSRVPGPSITQHDFKRCLLAEMTNPLKMKGGTDTRRYTVAGSSGPMPCLAEDSTSLPLKRASTSMSNPLPTRIRPDLINAGDGLDAIDAIPSSTGTWPADILETYENS